MSLPKNENSKESCDSKELKFEVAIQERATVMSKPPLWGDSTTKEVFPRSREYQAMLDAYEEDQKDESPEEREIRTKMAEDNRRWGNLIDE